MAPVVRGRKGEHAKLLEDARRSGYARVRVDGIMYELGEEILLEKNKKHSIEIVVDRLIIRPDIRKRLTDSIETACNLAGGLVIIDEVDAAEQLFSQNYACEDCGVSLAELQPRMFSFNNPYGACPTCTGLGFLMKVDPEFVVPDTNLSVNEGAIAASGWNISDKTSIASMFFGALAKHYKFSLDTPVKRLTRQQIEVLLYGTKGEKIEISYNSHHGGTGKYTQAFEGVVNNLERRYKETNSEYMRGEIEEYMSNIPCSDCNGQRLKKESLAVTVGGVNIADFCKLSVNEAHKFIGGLSLSEKDAMIADRIVKEIQERLGFLASVGLEYLNLSRASGTLSGGESQRIRLATQIGSSLMGVIYILDEPSIGLHQRDNDKLLATLKRLRDLGNTLLVVEHDEDTMFAADHIIDIGPGAGVHGGHIICQGSVEQVMRCETSVTGQYLSGRRRIELPSARRTGNGRTLAVRGARENNLKDIDVTLPLGTLICVTGVSGSGKSSLINEILYKRLATELNGAKKKAGKHERIEGMEFLDKVIAIDQSPIGRTPRSNPATYTGLFNDIRDIFAQTQDAKIMGYSAGRFSFNVRGGRCEACGGDGLIKIEMHFLPDIYVPCDVCKGRRYNRETLEVRFRGKNIYEVLDMTAEEAVSFFESIPRLRNKLSTLCEVGLGYVKLGQSSTTLSGGEAQRVKLATELSKRSTGRTVYILDEPTTGLHLADVHKLVDVLGRLVDTGNTVIIIEHNLEVVKMADYIIDLGPEGGDAGGRVICCGTPERVAADEASYTGRYLKKYLKKEEKRY